jgi:Flp pilus assembly protein TadD
MIFSELPSKSILILFVAVPLMVGGCSKSSLNDITGSIGTPTSALPSTEQGRREFTAEWGHRFDSNPSDKGNALNYARGLRSLTQYAQAVAVLQQAAVKHPNDLDVLGAYGKALADDGRLRQAADVLANAHTPEHPNWSILSAQGVVADQMGDHASAQNYYQAALKIVPGEPAVLSNLGLSYALDKHLDLAEQTMRQAVASPRADSRVRQNFALVLALEGKFPEAEAMEEHDLSPTDAASNVMQIRQMIAQSNTWRDIQKPAASSSPHSAVASAGR